MYKNKSFIAIIPARGGSKRLPQKNILNLQGKPLVVWSIESGLKSKYIDKVIVSSDSDEVLNISNKYGSDGIKRPNEFSADTSTSEEAIMHVISSVKKKYDYIVLLQPTSPLRNEKHIDESIELLYAKKADAIVSVCEVDHSPLWSNTLPKNDDMSNFLKEEGSKRSQDLETYYRLNGAIYICKTDKFIEEKSFFLKDNIFAYKMGKKYSIDIDEKIDFEMAEFFMKKY